MCKTFSDGLHSLSRLRHDRCKQKYLNKNFAIVRQPTNASYQRFETVKNCFHDFSHRCDSHLASSALAVGC